MLLEAPRSLRRYPVALRKFHQRYSSRDEVADAAQDVDSDMVRLATATKRRVSRKRM